MLIERRFQPLWILALGLLMTFSLGIAYGSVLIPIIGWIAGITTTIPVVWLWWRGRSDICINHGFLYIGKYRLEQKYVGEITALSSEQFLLRIRGQAGLSDLISIPNPKFGGIVIENKDDSDPYKHWVISSRNPEQTASRIASFASGLN